MKKTVEHNRKIGVIGGMGPDASVRVLQRIIDLSREEFGAKRNNEYPEIIMHSLSIEDFVEDDTKMRDGGRRIKKTAEEFNDLGVSCFGIACNTAHLVLEKEIITLPNSFVSIVDETVNEVKKRGIETVGLMGSPMTINSDMFRKRFESENIKLLVPNEKQTNQLGKLIMKVLRGDFSGVGEKLKVIADSLIERRAEVVILACTELPLVFPAGFKSSTIDTSEVLAKALLNKYYL